MQITVKLFAALRERAGRSQRAFDLPDGASAGDVWPALDIGDEPPGMTYARNREYAERNAPLATGDEVAVIPPVSGGSFRVQSEPLDLAALVAEVSRPDAGAIATFIGTTRDHARGRNVTHLEYDAYPEMAEQEMPRIADHLKATHDIHAVAMAHRTGTVPIGEASVIIAVSAPHRGPALEACHEAIDTLKQTVPVWKKEIFEGGEEWIGSEGTDEPQRRGLPSHMTPDQPTQLPPPVKESEPPPPPPEPEGRRPIAKDRNILQRISGRPAAAVLALFKFGWLLIAGLGKASFLFSFLIAIGAYTHLWRWRFALGFTLLILIHEMGHVIQLRREGVKATAPIFIPFLGAVVGMKDLPNNAYVEAKVGLAGPVLGTLGAFAVHAAGVQLDTDLLKALAYTGFLLNLFNLIPVLPLDGGRPPSALHPALWFSGCRCRRSRTGS